MDDVLLLNEALSIWLWTAPHAVVEAEGGREEGVVEMVGWGSVDRVSGEMDGGGVWREGCRDEGSLGCEVGLECAPTCPYLSEREWRCVAGVWWPLMDLEAAESSQG